MARGRKAGASEAGPVEERWALPDGWRWERLGTLASYVSRGRSPRYVEHDGVTVINQRCVRWHGIELAHAKLTNRAAAARLDAAQFVRTGDILWNSTGTGTIGRATVVPEQVADQGVVVDSHITIVRPAPERALSSWIKYWISTSAVQKAVAGTGSTNQVELNRAVVLETPIPVPPLDIQRRFVARIDELFTELDDGEAALASAKADLETYRQSLLRAAVTGELTADWRTENPPSETAEQLLKRILIERRARWKADPRNQGKNYREPLPVADIDLMALPPEWAWGSLGQFIDKVEAGLNVKALGRPPGEAETGIVKVSAVTWWDFDENASKTLTQGSSYEGSAIINAGDFLISRANTLELVGAPAIVRRVSRRLVLSDKVLRLVMPDELKEWVFFVLRSSWGRSFIEARSSGNQLSMRNLSQDNLKQLPIPLPPEGELKHLVEIMSVLTAGRTDLLREVQEGAVGASVLRQSILSAAFRGELVQ